MIRTRGVLVSGVCLALLVLVLVVIRFDRNSAENDLVSAHSMQSGHAEAGSPPATAHADAAKPPGPGVITMPAGAGSGSSSPAPPPIDGENFRYPAKEGKLAKLGEFEEREVRVFRHPDGSFRVKRLIHTDMKYPLVLVEEVFSGTGGTLARQELSVGDHLMVQFLPDTGRATIEAEVQAAGFSVRKWFQQPGLVLIEIPDPGLDSLQESAAKISANPLIEFTEWDDIVFAN